MKKFKLFFTRNLILTIFTTLTSTIAMAQSTGLAGLGTSGSPYKIYGIADWEIFTNEENAATYWASGVYVRLINDIGTAETPVTTMVGVWSENEADRKPFCGTFLGNNKTITVSYSNTDTEGKYTAPFVCTNNATIKQLTIEGDIVVSNNYGHAAGLIGVTYGSAVTKVQNNVKISVNITNGSNGSAGSYCAGVAVDGSMLEISSCIYDGKIIAVNNSAGFVAIGNENYTKIHTSLFAPAVGSSITGANNSAQNFVANEQVKRLATSYYTTQIATSTQGLRACSSYNDPALDNDFWMIKELYDKNDYYVEGTPSITGVNSQYYLSNIQHFGISYTVHFAEDDPDIAAVDVDDSYYTAVITNKNSGAVVNDISTIPVGSYTLTITGKEGYCKGTVTADFEVIANFVPYGSGTESDPYQITNESDWNAFANAVNGGYSCAGEYVKLMSDITLTITNTSSTTDKMVGKWVNNDNDYIAFSGTFDGNWKTITFNVGENSSTGAYNTLRSAPFRIIDGATIKNLTVEGTIYAKKKYMAGIACFNYGRTGETNLINCTSNISIICSYLNNDCSAGGLLAENKSGGVIRFTNCIFGGEINRGGATNAQKCAGFVSYNNGSDPSIYYNNCAMIGTIAMNNTGTFNRNNRYKVEEKGAYYINDYGFTTGFTHATITAPEPKTKIAKKCTTDNYYIPCAEVFGIESVYPDGSAVSLASVVVSWYGRTMTRGTDYNMSVDGVPVPTSETPTISGTGKHTITIEGIGNYGGSLDFIVLIKNFNTWNDVKEVLADVSLGTRTINLNADITPTTPTDDVVLEVYGEVVLNLNGHTINRGLFTNDGVDTNDHYVNRGQVIRIYEGASLTINGSGTITGGYNQALDDENDNEDGGSWKNDAGGIYNVGNLVLNNVIVTGNKCIKYTNVATNSAGTARGGGICNGAGSSFTMTGGAVTGNIAKGGGGGVYCYMPVSFSMTSVEISHNDSESKGGGLRIRTDKKTTAYLTDCVIKSNRATETDVTRGSDGGGVYMQIGNLHMERCIIGGEDEGNKSAFAGAGFFQLGGTTYAKDCTIIYNSAYTEHDRMYGGGICLYTGSTYTMDGGTIENNSSFQDGGGIFIMDGATFNVLGYVVIKDNFRVRTVYDEEGEATLEQTANNVYVADGNGAIHIIGPLDENSLIHITGHGAGGIYTSGLETYATLDNFETDGKYQLMNEWDGDLTEIKLVPFDWHSTDTWADQPGISIPNSGDDIIIDRAIIIEEGRIGEARSIEFQNGKIILRDGAQLECFENKTGTPIEILVQREIEGNTNPNNGWYGISLPIDYAILKDNYVYNTNLVTTKKAPFDFDLLRYDEPTHFWDSYNFTNYHFPTEFKSLEKGCGYLYRNQNDTLIDFSGYMNIGEVEYNVKYTATSGGNPNPLAGFQLIGNPYTHNVYKGDGCAIPNSDLLNPNFYTLKRDGTWSIGLDNDTIIKVCQGILVEAAKAGTLTMENTTSRGQRDSKSECGKIQFVVANNDYEDVAYAMFVNERGLHKINHFNEEAPMVYINRNNENFAIATMDNDVKVFNLNFEAKTTGKYTLSVNPEGNFKYIHLIDKLASKDVDMLLEGEYEFIGSTADNAGRFIVCLGNIDDGADDNFAYQNGSDIIVSGEGELQVFDVMGRFVTGKNINGAGTLSTSTLPAGVYILRMVGEKPRTQKIVVDRF